MSLKRQYAEFDFYKEQYAKGSSSAISDADFPYWSMQATSVIREKTFGNIDMLNEIPEAVQMCCCNVAEKLYQVDSAKDEKGMVMQSYGNDGETATFKVDDYTESAVERSIDAIIRRWLAHTGLMYCGVCE